MAAQEEHMRVYAFPIVVIGLFVSLRAHSPSATPALLGQIRADDTGAIQGSLQSGADPNTRDGTGATALMYAAAFASPEAMRLLLAAGADVNATNQAGATALMWATHDTAKVRLLLGRGVSVNAARADGATALLGAALRGNREVLDLLVAAGADRHVGRVATPWSTTLPQVALTTNDPGMQALGDASDRTAPKIAEWSPPPLTRWLLTSVYSWRPQPLATNAALVKGLLEGGANPNEIVSQLALTVPVLSRVARLGDVETMRVLLEHGADPNLKGSRGLTPLMMAAATTADPTMVRLLLDKGAAVDARDDNGQTPLDWALRLGDTQASRVLRKAGAVATAPRGTTPVAPPRGRGAKEAVELALPPLQAAGPRFAEKTRCISCHHQSLPSVAVTLAHAKGAATDRALANHPTPATLAVWARSRENMMLGNCSVFGFLGNVTYGLFGLSEEGVAPGPETDAVTSCLMGLQKPDGSWEGGDTRPPLAGRNPFVYTALAIRGLKVYSPPGRRQETASRIMHAREFLRTGAPADTQEEAFKLLGLFWADASSADISNQMRRLRALQHKDGGWSQLPTMPADAYASGQALYALRIAGTGATSDVYRDGVKYLLRTQLEDGTWYVRSRAIGFQPYIDSGFPHGPDQFISAAATAWAVIALSYAL
jgi:ankyrin repeat protein